MLAAKNTKRTLCLPNHQGAPLRFLQYLVLTNTLADTSFRAQRGIPLLSYAQLGAGISPASK